MTTRFHPLSWEKSLFFKPNIPKHKLVNSLKYFAGDILEEDVLVLLDITFGGTGKRGMALTNKKLYALCKKSGPKQIELNAIKKVAIKDGYKGLLSINDKEFCKYSLIFENDVQWYMKLLQDIHGGFISRERIALIQKKKEEVLNRAKQWWLYKPDPNNGKFICDVCNGVIQQKDGTSLLGSYMRCANCTQALFTRWNQGEDF